MPLPSSRLDLHLVPPDPDDRPRADAERLIAELRKRAILDERGFAGPEATRWIADGFRSVRIDDPGHVVLYANQQGGFRVSCPVCRENLVPVFMQALSSFRRGGPRRCTCPACGTDQPLDALDFLPAAAFGRLSVVTVDVGGAALTPEGVQLVGDLLGAWRTVLRRP